MEKEYEPLDWGNKTNYDKDGIIEEPLGWNKPVQLEDGRIISMNERLWGNY